MKSDLELNYLAIKFRKEHDVDEYSYVDIFDIANNIDYLSIVLYPMSNNISGMCIKQNKANVIVVNSTMSYGRQRFSLGHELYHLFFDSFDGMTISNLNIENSEIEKEADSFASYLLVPYNALSEELDVMNNKINIENLLKIEYKYKLSHIGLCYRLLKENRISSEQYDKFKIYNLKNIVSNKYYDNTLYMPTDVAHQKQTSGYYIKQVNKLKDLDLISKGKYDELLYTAFRNDLVHILN